MLSQNSFMRYVAWFSWFVVCLGVFFYLFQGHFMLTQKIQQENNLENLSCVLNHLLNVTLFKLFN